VKRHRPATPPLTERNLCKSIRLLCAAGLATAAGAANPAWAQDASAAAADPAPPRIVVTGSRIPMLNTDGASPITTLSARDIRIDGLRNVEDLLNNLPQVFGNQGEAISNGASGTATVDLRHMGPQRTLVLVNGKRLPAGSVLNAAADLNEIPAQLIQRVDVLTGGAAAVYGSGAVAGVVNFILKDDFTGVELEANGSGANHRQHNAEVENLARAKNYPLPDNRGLDARKSDFSLLAGTNFAGHEGNVTVFLGYREASALLQSARDFSSCSLGPATPRLVCAGSTTSVARLGNFTPDAHGNPRPFTDADAYNFGPLNFYQRPSHETKAHVTLHYDITPDARLYNDTNFHDYRTTAQIAPGGIFFGQQASIAYENPLLNDAWRAALGLKKPGDVAKVFVGKRNVEGGPRDTYLTDRSVRDVLGIKGLAAGWDYDVFAQFARVNHGDQVDGYFSSRRIVRALDVVPDANGKPACRTALSGIDTACVPYDMVHAGGITRQAIDYLQASGADSGYTQQSVLGANAGTDLGRYGLRAPGTDRGLSVSLGYEQRVQKLVLEPDEERRSGDLSGAGGAVQPVHGSYRVQEAFGEFRLPVLAGLPLARRLDLSGAYRRSHYSTATDTNTFGLGLDWETASWLRVRASSQRAMRAPTILELYTPPSVLLTGPTADPCGGASPRATLVQCQNTGLPAALYGKVPANTTSQYNGHSGGNPDVKPETANTVTLGLVIEPARNLTLTLDAFRLKVRNAIQPYNAQVLFNQCLTTGDPVYCKLIHRDSAGSLWLTTDGYVEAGVTNIGSQATSGLDLGAGWRTRLPDAGSLALALNGTWVRSFEVENLPGKGTYDCAGLFGAACGVPIPHWRHKLRATWSTPWQLELSATWRYLDRVRNDKLAPSPQLAAPLATPRDTALASRSYLDLNASVRLAHGVTLGAGVNNLLDKDPPFASSASVTSTLGNGNTYPQVYDTYGRVLYANLTWRF
jgi:outer membrane receptor protein involved in Fe transport